jgi:hypothetical protein
MNPELAAANGKGVLYNNMIKLILSAWILVQAIIFALSVWFIVFGIRNYNARKLFAITLFILGFGGVLMVVRNLLAAGLL